MDLSATYTYATPHFPTPTQTVTTRVRTRQRDGGVFTSVRGLAPLLADRIEAITDEGDRLHTLMALDGESITISDTERTDVASSLVAGLVGTRDGCRITTTYKGTPDLPVDVVLDLAEQIRDQLAAEKAAQDAARAAEAARWDHLPWDIDHPDRDLLDQALAAGVPVAEIVRIADARCLGSGRGLRRGEEMTLRRFIMERRDALGLATDRQVEYILALLSGRRRSGEGGGFMSGPTDRAGISQLTREDASAYIDSLKGTY